MIAADFQKLLFKAAVSVMAVDGEIHASEIEEIKSIVSHTAYFLDFEFEKELQKNIDEIKKEGKKAINNFLESLKNAELTEKQELILMEVVIRMIEADTKIGLSEIKFLQLMKSRIKTPEETLITKFPKQVKYLIDFNNYGSAGLFEIDININ